MQLKRQPLFIKPVHINTINDRNKKNLLNLPSSVYFQQSISKSSVAGALRLAMTALCWTLWSTGNETEEVTALLKIKTYKQEIIDNSPRQHTIKRVEQTWLCLT